MASAVLMAALDSTMLLVALPSMLEDLQTNLSWLGWAITANLLSTTITMPLVGRVSDDLGRKRVFVAAALIFTAASLLAALAPNVQWLIFCRIVQGIGGGALMPSTIGIVSDEFPKRRATMIGLFTAIWPIGGVVGPNIGGWLVQNFSWRSIYYVNLPIGIAVAVLAYALLHDTSPRVQGKLDLKGAILLSATVLCFMYAFTRISESEARLGDALVWIGLVAGGLALVGFVWHEDRVTEPILDLALLRWKPFVATNLFNFLLGTCTYGVYSLMPLYATIAYNMTPSQSGLLMTPRSLSMIVMALVGSLLLNRVGYRMPIIGGILVLAFAAFYLSQRYVEPVILGWQIDNFVVLAFAFTLNGLGMGISTPATHNAAIELMPDRVAAITGLRGMFRTMGGVVGTSAILLVLSLYEDRAAGFQAVFFGVSVFLAAMTPLALLIPDRAGSLAQRQLDDV
ncbi:MAG: DHA2 family efflux MFS transporter permease subunit [Chloroflexi bacterium]|nr:DHA2 family efflux MFS transporter permease subunit [Chloroflexota bacterium]